MKRRQIRAWENLGPWHGRVSTYEISDIAHTRQTSLPHEPLFETLAEWTGPPAPGFPPSDTAVQAQASITVDDYLHAHVLAQIAVRKLQQGKIPDLRAAGLQAIRPI